MTTMFHAIPWPQPDVSVLWAGRSLRVLPWCWVCCVTTMFQAIPRPKPDISVPRAGRSRAGHDGGCVV